VQVQPLFPEEDVDKFRRSKSYYEAAAVCRRGHIKTQYIKPFESHADDAKCVKCGATVLIGCVSCGLRIRGDYFSPGILVGPDPVPSFCDGCGAAHPWAPKEATTELISPGTRGIFRDLMTDSTVGAISTAFTDEGFSPDEAISYEDSSVRRRRTQEFLSVIDWSSPDETQRALAVFERLLWSFRPGRYDASHRWAQLVRSLERDGYRLDNEGRISRIGPTAPRLPEESLANLTDATAIREQLDRIQRAIPDDPALAVGSAKELIESTAKVVLIERGKAVDERADIQQLIKGAQEALRLHPSSATPGPDGSEAVKRILGGVSTIALGVAELRNRGYGTGHGGVTRRVGLGWRHAHLAVNAAVTWSQLMLDTLADSEAPWRKGAQD
jgi:Abortive infection C-terminus/Uncharacterized protein conserved in bacteria (DUF2321)